MNAQVTAWETLAAQMRSCALCPELVLERSNVVVGQLPRLGANVMLVGEAPGATEDETGEPFVGKAGKLLDELLEEVGLPRSQVSITNVLKCRPPKNRKPTRVEVGRCRRFLTTQLAIVDPLVVVALGGTAVEWFFGTGAKIADLRGRAHDRDGRRVVPTYHPSAAIRFGRDGMPHAALRDDLALAVREVTALTRRPSRGTR